VVSRGRGSGPGTGAGLITHGLDGSLARRGVAIEPAADVPVPRQTALLVQQTEGPVDDVDFFGRGKEAFGDSMAVLPVSRMVSEKRLSRSEPNKIVRAFATKPGSSGRKMTRMRQDSPGDMKSSLHPLSTTKGASGSTVSNTIGSP